jgi:hypothetical protein
MPEKLKAAFMFVAPGAVPEKDRQWVRTPAVDLLTVGVADYSQAAETAVRLMAEGIAAIELCGGFGNRGVALVADAVEGRIPVGVVRFDIHPGLGNVSGDQIFSGAA